MQLTKDNAAELLRHATSYARKLTTDRALADDIAQKAMLALARKDRQCKLSSLVRWSWKDTLKKQARQKQYTGQKMEIVQAREYDTATLPTMPTLLADTAGKLALGYSPSELAKMENVSKQAISNRIAKIRKYFE